MGRLNYALMLGVALCFSPPGPSAAQGRIEHPAIVKSAVAAAKAECEGGRGTLSAAALKVRDINGDGILDYHLDFGGLSCPSGGRVRCGSGGCTHQVFASMPDGTVRKVLDVLAQQVTFKRMKGRPSAKLDLHGSECGRSGFERCSQTLYWNGFQFSSAN